jgi:hypothetical protein
LHGRGLSAGTAKGIPNMKNVSLFLALLVAAGACAAQTQAQPSGTVSCDDVQWKDARIAKSCIGVVERNGLRYVKLSGKVTRKSKDSITVLLDHSKEPLTWMPDLGETVSIDGKETEPMSVSIGQQLSFYLPAAQVATN